MLKNCRPLEDTRHSLVQYQERPHPRPLPPPCPYATCLALLAQHLPNPLSPTAKYRAILELFTFLVLFFSFLSVVTNHRRRDPNLPVSALSSHELWFFVYALGYSLDKIASIMEHGWSVSSSQVSYLQGSHP